MNKKNNNMNTITTIDYDESQRSAIDQLQDLSNQVAQGSNHVKGVFLWGKVGRGKTIIMNAFFEQVPIKEKLRIHYYDFVKKLQEELHQHQHIDNKLDVIAEEIAKKYRLICLDEFNITNICDARIVSKVFEILFKQGTVFCITSNNQPKIIFDNIDLTEQHLFVEILNDFKNNLHWVEIEGGVDYRIQPKTENLILSEDDISKIFNSFKAQLISEDIIQIQKRPVAVKKLTADVAWFEFKELCATPKAKSDYTEIATKFKTVLISNVPRFENTLTNQAKRFIWLVSILYDHGTSLAYSAQYPPKELYHGTILKEEFKRATSRLTEMLGVFEY